ncbi:MAG: hypothetical protein COV73_00990 [Candidatus Omnitrophica bacterium CG11_big_fil_rev_8_21_14_0_20_43_6]|nr:MAG: hypothetical protein COV73_00990 [Candidatus Omnitrophica bacterium CG11_big_fil_rev_8_21_14_0_20_43_6]
MKLNKLSLSNQKLFNRYLNLLPHELAAFSFANIYIWKALYDINWAVIQDNLCIFFRDPLGCFMYLPPISGEVGPQVIEQAFALMDKINQNQDISRIENIQQQDLGYYRSLGYAVREKYPDYLCLRSELAQLKGNKFKSQRAAYNYFIKHYDYDVRRFNRLARSGCLDLFGSWVKERKSQCSDEVYCGMLEDNHKVIRAALVNYQQLNFTGIVVRINKAIRGFSFGYRLNDDTFCILYEITDLSIKGLAQFIFRQFSQKLKDYKYINIMDDSGLENLRKTKLAYKPARLIAAYIATKR